MAKKKPKKNTTIQTLKKQDLPVADFLQGKFDEMVQAPTQTLSDPFINNALLGPGGQMYNLLGPQSDAFRESDYYNPQSLEQYNNALGLSQRAGQAFGQENDLLAALAQRGLQGMTPEAMQMARERARQEITNSLNSAVRGSLGSAGNLGIFGRDVTRGLTQGGALASNANALGNLERDLFLQNLAYMDANTQNALTLGNEIQARRFGEQNAAQQALGDASGMLTSTRNQFFQNKYNQALSNANFLNGVSTTNRDNLNAYNLARFGAFTGGIDYGQTERNNQAANKLANRSISQSGTSRSNGSGNVTFNVAGGQNTQPGGPTNNNSAAQGSAYG